MFLGILVSASGVYAISEFNSNNVYYDNSNSALVSKNVQDAIDEIAAREITGCPDFLICKAPPATEKITNLLITELKQQ